MNEQNRRIWIDGTIQPKSKAFIPAETRGLMYGAGCFETFRSYEGRYLHLDKHLDRFNAGLMYLGVNREDRLKEDEVRQLLMELLTANNMESEESIIRLQGALKGSRGYEKSEADTFHLIVSLSPVPDENKKYRLQEVNTRVIPSTCRPSDLKLSNNLHYMKALRSAKKQNADDAIMLTTEGFVSETSIANIFWKKEHMIFTPDVDCDLLPGIIRNSVCSIISGHEKWELSVGNYRPADLQSADLVWITNSVRELQPVSSVNNQTKPVDDLFYGELRSAFESYKQVHSQ